MLRVTIGLIALCVAAAATAQPSAPPAPGAEARALGRRMAEAGDFNAIIGAMGAAEIERMARETTGLSDAERNSLRAIGGRVFAARRAAILDRVGEIYARQFTLPQLRRIVAFLEGPSGRSYTSAFPRIVPEIAAVLQGVDFGAEVRAAYCRDLGRLCEAPVPLPPPAQ